MLSCIKKTTKDTVSQEESGGKKKALFTVLYLLIRNKHLSVKSLILLSLFSRENAVTGIVGYERPFVYNMVQYSVKIHEMPLQLGFRFAGLS